MLLGHCPRVHGFNQLFRAIIELIRINVFRVDSVVSLLLARSIGQVSNRISSRGCSDLADLACTIDMWQLATLLVTDTGIGIVRALVNVFIFAGVALVAEA